MPFNWTWNLPDFERRRLQEKRFEPVFSSAEVEGTKPVYTPKEVDRDKVRDLMRSPFRDFLVDVDRRATQGLPRSGEEAIALLQRPMLPGKETAQKIAVRTLLEPSIPGETAERMIEKIPGASRKSKFLGQGIENILNTFSTENLVKPRTLSDLIVESPEQEAARRIGPKVEIGEVSPARVARRAEEIFFPSPAEMLLRLAPGGVALAGLAGSLRKKGASRGFKALTEAEELLRKEEALKAMRDVSEAAEADPYFRAKIPPPVLSEPPRTQIEQAQEMLSRPKAPRPPDPLEAEADVRRGLRLSAEGLKEPETASELLQRAGALEEASAAKKAAKRAKELGEGRTFLDEIYGDIVPPDIDTWRKTDARLHRLLEEAANPPAPVGKEFIGKAGIGKTDFLRPTTNLIRDMGGMASNVPREVANRVAAMFDNGALDFKKALNWTVATAKPILKAISKLSLQDEIALGRAMDKMEYTGIKHLDDILVPYYKRRAEQFRQATKEGIPVPGRTGLPHINPESTEIALQANVNEGKARQMIAALFAKHAPGTVYTRELEDQVFRQMQSYGAELMPSEGTLVKFLPNITESRGAVPLPGHIADVNSPHYKRGGVADAIRQYDRQWAFGVADARHFGPQAERFIEAMESAPNPIFTDYVRRHRQNYLGGSYGKTPFDRAARSFAVEFRQVLTSAMLGKAYIPQLFETLPKVLPKSQAVIGLTRGAEVYRKAIDEFVKLPEGAVKYAHDIGLLAEQYAMDLAGAHSLFERGAAKAKILPELVMGKLTPFELFNKLTYGVASAGGKLHLGELGRSLYGGGKEALRAEEYIRALMPAAVDDAEMLIQAGKRGTDLRLDESVKAARDRYAYEFARGAAGDAGPNTTALVFSTDTGRLVYHLKNFDYQYARFIWNDLIGEARKGNFAPITTWAFVAAPASGFATRVARMATAGDWEGIQDMVNDEGVAESFILAHGAAGGFGFAGTATSGFAGILSGQLGGTVRGISQLAGPTIGFLPVAAMRAQAAGGGLEGWGSALYRGLVPDPLGLPKMAERAIRGADVYRDRDFQPEWLTDQEWYTRPLDDWIAEIRGAVTPSQPEMPVPTTTGTSAFDRKF